jgi:hypothetical protein
MAMASHITTLANDDIKKHERALGRFLLTYVLSNEDLVHILSARVGYLMLHQLLVEENRRLGLVGLDTPNIIRFLNQKQVIYPTIIHNMCQIHQILEEVAIISVANYHLTLD